MGAFISKLLDDLNFTYYFVFESCAKIFNERKKSARNISSFYENEMHHLYPMNLLDQLKKFHIRIQ